MKQQHNQTGKNITGKSVKKDFSLQGQIGRSGFITQAIQNLLIYLSFEAICLRKVGQIIS